MNKSRLLAYVFVFIILYGCDKQLEPKSDCIDDWINKIKSEGVRNPPAAIWQYYYNGQFVYFIPAHCCDFASILLSMDCEIICNPDGGLTGNGDGKCSDFFAKRTNEKLIWMDTRK